MFDRTIERSIVCSCDCAIVRLCNCVIVQWLNGEHVHVPAHAVGHGQVPVVVHGHVQNHIRALDPDDMLLGRVDAHVNVLALVHVNYHEEDHHQAQVINNGLIPQ